MSPRQHSPSTTPESIARAKSIARFLGSIACDSCADQPQTTHPTSEPIPHPAHSTDPPVVTTSKFPKILHVYILALLLLLASISAGIFEVNNTLSNRVEVYANTDVNVHDIYLDGIENQLKNIDRTINNFRTTYSTTDTGDIERNLEDINSSIDALHSALTDLELTIKYK